MMPGLDAIRGQVTDRGYFVGNVTTCFGERDLLDLATGLGCPQRSLRSDAVVDFLKAKPAHRAFPNSLSSRFGLGRFPLHTDDAIARLPAKYLLLHNREGGELAATVLLDMVRVFKGLDRQERAELTEAVFYIRNGLKSFPTTLVDPEHHYVRFDPNILRPTGRRALQLLNAIRTGIEQENVERITWSRPTVLVVDNHRVLHGREAVREIRPSVVRTLLRILVQERQ